jgi:hypothetical protein
MTIPASRWLLRWKWTLVALGLPVLVALWWAFRPEKLWINQKVNEPVPFDTSADPKPVLTGRFEAKAEQTSGRATIYKKPGGEEYLRLSDFAAANAPDAHVWLGRGEGDLNRIDLGPLKSNRGDQNYDLPAATDLSKYDAVVIYSEQSHAVSGLARLESF